MPGPGTKDIAGCGALFVSCSYSVCLFSNNKLAAKVVSIGSYKFQAVNTWSICFHKERDGMPVKMCKCLAQPGFIPI